MIDKQLEIEILKDKQVVLKEDIAKLKTKLPTFLLGFIFISVCIIYYLEDKVYRFFGNAINFIRFGVILSVIISVIFAYASYSRIYKKQQELKRIGSKLYSLMKLEKNSFNE